MEAHFQDTTVQLESEDSIHDIYECEIKYTGVKKYYIEKLAAELVMRRHVEQ